MGKTANYQIAGTLTVLTTGTINNLDVKGYSTLIMGNSSDATINGIVAGYAGQILTIHSEGVGNLYLSHENISSTAANRLWNFITTTNTPIAALKGKAIYQYDDGLARWILINHDQGAPITIPYSSGNFTVSSGTWTVDSGDQTTFSYYFQDTICEVAIQLDGTTYTGGGATTMDITIPFTPSNSIFAWARCIANGTASPGMSRVIAATAKILVYYDVSAGTWTTSTNNNGIQTLIRFKVD